MYYNISMKVSGINSVETHLQGYNIPTKYNPIALALSTHFPAFEIIGQGKDRIKEP